MNRDPDAELVRLCQQKSASSLEGDYRRLYDRYKDRVYNVCFRITGNPSDALDASQETFGILFRRIREFRFESRFSSWVYRIAVNASIDIKRRAQTRKLSSLEAIQERSGDRNGGGRFDPVDERVEMPVAAASRHELERQIQAAILRLSPKLRAITVLRYVENLSYEQISETLQISLGTVKSRLARAHDVLDRELTPVLDRFYLG
jgi:RNA polymerase sigma-70 factor (ECF subfamily)